MRRCRPSRTGSSSCTTERRSSGRPCWTIGTTMWRSRGSRMTSNTTTAIAPRTSKWSIGLDGSVRRGVEPLRMSGPKAAGAHPARRVPRRGRRTLRFAPGIAWRGGVRPRATAAATRPPPRRARPLRDRSRQRNMPRHAHARRGRETERRATAPPSFFFFRTVRLRRMIVTASTPAPRSPDFVRRARRHYGG